jgi:ribosomal protein S18 acetylase RimI-like enzyme
MVQDVKTIEDKWLSGQVGRPAYCLNGEISQGDLDRLPKSGLFAYTKVAADNVALVRKYSELGFRVVDCAVSLRQQHVVSSASAAQSTEIQFRPAVPADEEAVAGIAATAFTYSRFHLDPAFTQEVANRVKESWVRNFFRGQRGDQLWVATMGSDVAGFSLMLKGTSHQVIDLIAVSPRFQGRGVGKTLISGLNQELGPLEVGTQISNVPSIRLYQNAGFFLVGSKYVLHLHR